MYNKFHQSKTVENVFLNFIYMRSDFENKKETIKQILFETLSKNILLKYFN